MASGEIRPVKPVVILSHSAVPYDSHEPSIEIIPAGRMVPRPGIRLTWSSEGLVDGSKGSWLSILAEVDVGESRSGILVLKGHSLAPKGCVYQISLRLL